MKRLDLTINVSKERVITVELPEDITPGKHHAVLVIDQKPADGFETGLFSLEGLWADGPEIAPEDVADAQGDMAEV